MTTLTRTATLTAMSCGDCGVVFALDDDYISARRDDHRTWYCPNGHSRYYPTESNAEKYERLYRQSEDRAAATRAERDQIEASRRAWKGQVTRLRKAAIEGDCPLCGQHLRDLARHVARIHPTEQAEIVEPTSETVA